MSASYKTKLILAFRSGNVCAMPDCGQTLSPESSSGNPANVGEAAHIAGEHDGKSAAKRSARFDPKMSIEERNHYNNLLYLCGTCHTLIDAMPQCEVDFPVSRLQAIKQNHETKVRQAMIEAFVGVGFPELEEATKWATQLEPSSVSTDYSLLKVKDKINKNDLGNEVISVIAAGLGVASEVARYVDNVALTDPDYPERLKAGFLGEFWRLKKDGVSGSELFELMCQFSQQGFSRQVERSAGLAVLIHLFEVCEVFEK